MTSIETGVTTALGDPPPPRSEGEYPVGTGSRGSRVLGATTIVLLAVGIAFSLVISPADANQGNAARLLYIHVPSAIVAYVAFGVTALASAMVLWKKTEFWDVLAGASAEIGVLFTGLCLLTGMLWGRPIWGVYWTWDARLTSVAIMFVMYLGYLLLRGMIEDPERRARFAAVVGVVAALNMPLVHFSVYWWRTLHQPPSILRPGPSSLPAVFWRVVLVHLLAFALLYVYFVVKRTRLLAREVEGLG